MIIQKDAGIWMRRIKRVQQRGTGMGLVYVADEEKMETEVGPPWAISKDSVEWEDRMN